MDVSGYAKMYLEWLGENEPEYLRHLLQTHQLSKLEHQIDQKLAMAALVIDREMKRGISYREAEEIAVGTILARADGRAIMEDPAQSRL